MYVSMLVCVSVSMCLCICAMCLCVWFSMCCSCFYVCTCVHVYMHFQGPTLRISTCSLAASPPSQAHLPLSLSCQARSAWELLPSLALRILTTDCFHFALWFHSSASVLGREFLSVSEACQCAGSGAWLQHPVWKPSKQSCH